MCEQPTWGHLQKNNDGGQNSRGDAGHQAVPNTTKDMLKRLDIVTKLLRDISMDKFETFKGEWTMHKQAKNIPERVIPVHLYGLCSEDVRVALKATQTHEQLMQLREA